MVAKQELAPAIIQAQEVNLKPVLMLIPAALRILALLLLIASLLESKPLAVSTVPLKQGALQKQSVFVGRLTYKESSKIASQQRGIVDKVHFAVGDRITKGQRLVSLNSDLLKKELEVKLAKLQEAKYQAQKMQNELARYKNLLDARSIALQQYETRDFDLKAKQAQVLALQADYDLSLEEMKKMSITSPYQGVILERLTNVGEWLGVGDSVAVIVNTAKIEVLVHVPSSIVGFLKLQQKVPLRINGKDYQGVIVALVPKADLRSKNFPVYIQLDSHADFFDGMAAQARLNTSGRAEGYIVPRDSLVLYQKQNSVFVVRDDKAVALPVRTLSVQDSEAVVLGDFLEGDLVVAKGQDRLFDGAAVIESKRLAKGDS